MVVISGAILGLRPLLARLLAATALGFVASPATAQAYPERNVRLIVPFAAGGLSDVSARIMGDAMSKALGQTVTIENAPGASGITGTLRVKSATPDGYTIGLDTVFTIAAAVATYSKPPYDPRTGFDYLGLIYVEPILLVARKDFPASTLSEFSAFAMAKGRELKMGHSGTGSLSHLACLVYFQRIDVEPDFVAFPGTSHTMSALLSGSIDGTCSSVAAAAGHARSGSVKVLSVASVKRVLALPDVPAAAEGGLPAFQVESWLGLYTPKGTPEPILAKLRAAVLKAQEDPWVEKVFSDLGGAIPASERRGAEYMTKFVADEVVRWSEVAKRAGLPQTANR